MSLELSEKTFPKIVDSERSVFTIPNFAPNLFEKLNIQKELSIKNLDCHIKLERSEDSKKENQKSFPIKACQSSTSKKKTIFPNSLRVISIYKFVKTFIKALKYRILYKDYHNLKKRHLEIIDDIAVADEVLEYDFNSQDGMEKSSNFSFISKIPMLQFKFQVKFFRILKRKFQKMIDVVPILSYSKKAFILWDIMMVLFSFYFISVIPITISFDATFHQNSFCFVIFEKIAFFSFVIDIIFKLNTTYLENGNEVHTRRKIICHYLKNNFFFDFLSLIGIYFHTNSDGKFYFELFALLKISAFSHFMKSIEERFVFNDLYEGILQILRLIIKILFIAHLLACFFNLLSSEVIRNNPDLDSWLIRSNLLNVSWPKRYLNTYYWSITTLATVGYGDIVPCNNLEKIYCIIAMLIGGGIFAFNINKLSYIFGDISKNSREIKGNLKILNQMMMRKKLNSNLQSKIRNYFHYIYKKENKKQLELENSLFLKLSKQLQQEIILNSNASILKQSKFFCNNFSEEFLQNIVFKMKPKLYSPEEIIFIDAELNPSVFFISQGKVKLFFDNQKGENNEVTLYEVKTGESFGEINLINNEEYRYSCKSIGFSSIYSISRKDFLDVLERFPVDKEKFCMIRDSIVLYQNYELLYQECKLCGSTFHSTEKCNFVVFQSHKVKILYKCLNEYKYSKNQMRRVFNRHPFKRRKDTFKKRSNVELPTLFSNRNDNELIFYKTKTLSNAKSSLKTDETKTFNDFISKESRDNYEYADSMDTREKYFQFITRNSMTYRTTSEKKKTSDEEIEIEEKLITQNSDENNVGSIKEGIRIKSLPFDIETVYNFQHYFPSNNASNVVRKLNSDNLLNLSTVNSVNIRTHLKPRGVILKKGQFLFKSNK